MLEGLVGLDSLGPSVYIAFGLLWILVSRLVRGRSPASRVEDVGKGDRAAVVLNKKLVTINRNTAYRSARATFLDSAYVKRKGIAPIPKQPSL
jgi:hypothetical protein